MEGKEYILSIIDYRGKRIVLTREVYESHIYSTEKSEKDKEAREQALHLVPQVLKRPRFVYYNYDDPESLCHRYIDLVYIPETAESLKALMVVVDNSCEPGEIKTWHLKSKLKQEKTRQGGIIYDAHDNIGDEV